VPKTRAQQNRFIRQEALRDQLEGQGHVQYLVEISEKLRELDAESGKGLETLDIVRLKAAAEIHKGLVDKYLPSLKQSDSTITMDATVTNATDAELDARLAAALAERTEGGSS